MTWDGRIRADARAIPLMNECVQTVVTSPPYWGLRKYSVDGEQIGVERTPEEYLETMVAVFREVWRVLKKDGTLWLNLGDTYAANRSYQVVDNKHVDVGNDSAARVPAGLKPKDLVGIPWRVAFALQEDGWVLRQEIIWAKTNPMPESVRDRCTKSHEQIFMFAKARWAGAPKRQFASISDQDARWLAMFIDTEGNITVKRATMASGKTTYGIQIGFSNSHYGLLEEAQRIIGRGTIAERPGKNAPMFYLQMSNNQAADLLHRIYGFFIVKKRQAALGIYLQEQLADSDGERHSKEGRLRGRGRSDEYTAMLERLWATNKLLNHFGNPDVSWIPEPSFGRWADCERYYYDAEAIAEACAYPDGPNSPQSIKSPHGQGFTRTAPTWAERKALGEGPRRGFSQNAPEGCHRVGGGETRSKRSVWTVSTQPYPEAHYATFPEEIPETCIRAGSKPGDLILDPFFGSGTVGRVAERLSRRWIGCDLGYQELQKKRLKGVQKELICS